MTEQIRTKRNNKRSSKKKKWIIVFICAVIVMALVAGGLYLYFSDNNEMEEFYIEPAGTENIADTRPENPIDFDKLWEINTDIYAWITIDGTNVDYPILQSTETSDEFYLKHDMYRNSSVYGSIYTEMAYEKDFSDRVTLIYGHNMRNGSMFRTLHKFEDEEFFNEYDEIVIYMPGKKLTYKIYAAYQYDNRHILNSFDFDDDAVYAEYLKNSQNPYSMVKNTREVELDTDDRIIVLSTCTSSNAYRYLVHAVLISEEETKVPATTADVTTQ